MQQFIQRVCHIIRNVGALSRDFVVEYVSKLSERNERSEKERIQIQKYFIQPRRKITCAVRCHDLSLFKDSLWKVITVFRRDLLYCTVAESLWCLEDAQGCPWCFSFYEISSSAPSAPVAPEQSPEQSWMLEFSLSEESERHFIFPTHTYTVYKLIYRLFLCHFLHVPHSNARISPLMCTSSATMLFY